MICLLKMLGFQFANYSTTGKPSQILVHLSPQFFSVKTPNNPQALQEMLQIFTSQELCAGRVTVAGIASGNFGGVANRTITIFDR